MAEVGKRVTVGVDESSDGAGDRKQAPRQGPPRHLLASGGGQKYGGHTVIRRVTVSAGFVNPMLSRV